VSIPARFDRVTERIGYKRAPMNTLTLNGVPAEFAYQKSLDTVQKRHHVRLWKKSHRAHVWMELRPKIFRVLRLIRLD
jgi:hypothetical protein